VIYSHLVIRSWPWMTKRIEPDRGVDLPPFQLDDTTKIPNQISLIPAAAHLGSTTAIVRHGPTKYIKGNMPTTI